MEKLVQDFLKKLGSTYEKKQKALQKEALALPNAREEMQSLKDFVGKRIEVDNSFNFQLDVYTGLIIMYLTFKDGLEFGRVYLNVEGLIQNVRIPDFKVMKSEIISLKGDYSLFYQDYFILLNFLKTEAFKTHFFRTIRPFKSFLIKKAELRKMSNILLNLES